MFVFLVDLLKSLQEFQAFLNMLQSIGAIEHSNGVFYAPNQVRNMAGGVTLDSILCSVGGLQASTCSALAVI